MTSYSPGMGNHDPGTHAADNRRDDLMDGRRDDPEPECPDVYEASGASAVLAFTADGPMFYDMGEPACRAAYTTLPGDTPVVKLLTDVAAPSAESAMIEVNPDGGVNVMVPAGYTALVQGDLSKPGVAGRTLVIGADSPHNAGLVGVSKAAERSMDKAGAARVSIDDDLNRIGKNRIATVQVHAGLPTRGAVAAHAPVDDGACDAPER